eukprot:TRINITY_DN317_c0_g1_i1.p1 TRINITY_DN317_c0_g1~~TRINITY_DN317_c0_g1_i1.p1  ORF type:complete len:688 (+),score=133.69 TRINITY_DN317_c0_g1_i1:237-2300(+)
MAKSSSNAEQETFKQGLDESAIQSMMTRDDMSSVEWLQTFADSNIPVRRLVAARDLSSVIKDFDYESAVQIIVPLLTDLKQDKIANVRQSLAESIAGLATYFIKFHQEPSEFFGWEITQFLLPVIYSLMSDHMLPVRLGAMQSLVKISKLMGAAYAETVILSSLDRMLREGNEDCITISLEAMSYLAEQLSPDSCQRLIINPIISCLKTSTFRIRKTIAGSLERLSASAGYQISVAILLPIYLRLAKDEIWGIRKTCAETIVGFAKSLPIDKAAACLLPIMSGFLVDFSRWVRFSASESLGPFLYHLGPKYLDEQLLRHFLSMSKTPELGYGDPESSYYCAFSFAAIVSMLGADRWKDLQATFDILIKDLQIRVRRCMAASLPAIAQALGPDMTKALLLPIFIKYMSDTDEVKYVAIRRLSDFIQLVPEEDRISLLTLLPKIVCDTANNWRIRKKIVKQLAKACDLCTNLHLSHFIMPLMFTLCVDRVFVVRKSACNNMWHLYRSLCEDKTDDFETFHSLVDRLKRARNYIDRQSCVSISVTLLLNCPTSPESPWLEHIKSLEQDPVTNVRVSCCHAYLEMLAGPEIYHQEARLALERIVSTERVDSIVSLAKAGLENPRPILLTGLTGSFIAREHMKTKTHSLIGQGVSDKRLEMESSESHSNLSSSPPKSFEESVFGENSATSVQ